VGNAYKILVRKREEKRQFVKPRRRGRMILDWILGKKFEKVWTGFMWLRIRTVRGGGGFCRENGNNFRVP
jgi:hypothetical protein